MTAAWLVHLFTASGSVLALLAAADTYQYRYRNAFTWLALAMIVDATDGVLARRVNVRARLPWFDGAQLDNLVDYLTYAFVPALFVWRAILVPAVWTLPVAGAMLLSSAYGFSRSDAKTADHYFTGFPSYWNIVVFYLLIGGLSAEVNAAILLILAALVFLPIRYIYPSRTPVLRNVTLTLAVVWGALMFVMLRQMPGVSRPVFWLSLVFPAYYVGLSLTLDFRRRQLRH